MRFINRRRYSPKLRSLKPDLERLEARELLSTIIGPEPLTVVSSSSPDAGFYAEPMFTVIAPTASSAPPSGAFTPTQIETAYGFNKIVFGTVQGNGTGETIGIVDAQDDPNIQSDLNVFDTQFGLPSITITRVNQTGGTSYPATDSTGGWELEESLDVEWAHAIAPGAKILLVEANSASDTDLLAAVDYAAAHANVVSMSWGGSEFSGENASSVESNFIHANVAFVTSSGDDGAPASWPAVSPNVLAVGGTTLTLGAGNTWSSETGWSDSGGGPSEFETQPSYQSGVVTQTTTQRANPDVAYDANPSTGFAVYDSFPYERTTYDWIQVGGTSAGSPQWAALLAIADQGRALSGQLPLDSTNPQEVETLLYQNAATGDFHDITSGTSTGSPHYSAGLGYDYVTGLGSPVANLVAQSLDGTVVTPVSNDHLVLSTATSVTAGLVLEVTVSADTAAGATDTGYLGTIHFTSSDIQAGLPSNYTFSATDKGSHTFAVTLKTAGNESITATDTGTSAITGTVSGIAVSPAAASQLKLTGLPTTTTVGSPVTLTVTAYDPYGNVATGYSGTVRFSSSDTQASLPPSYTFGGTDQGKHTFSVTFGTVGTQSLTLTDSVSGLTATLSGLTVTLAAPLNLAAQAVSTTQINLTWTGVTGAGGYLVDRSTNGSTGWTQIGTTAAGTTSYQDTTLSPGTTYYYQVFATSGNVDSAASNTASSTTFSATTGATTSDSLWSNTYQPNENAYSFGLYEVGVKFLSSVAGTVTGVRFYKESFMNGYTHVGHLWSATGTLLATATFTNESPSGWQQVNFSTPVPIAANTVYVVSFSTGGGYFGITTNYFSRAGVISGPLQALSNGVSGGDGVYQSGNGSFPNVDSGGMNFWADVAFAPSTSTSISTTGSSGVHSQILATIPTESKKSTSPSIVVQGTHSATQPSLTVVPVSWPYRYTVLQAMLPNSTDRESPSLFDS